MDVDRLTVIAERTFLDLLDSWVGYDGMPSNMHPYKQGSYIHVTFPSLSNEVSTLKSSWFIAASLDKDLHREFDEKLACTICKFKLSKKLIQELQEFCNNQRNTYIAFAIKKTDTNNLSDLVPFDRFDWYVMNLKQYFNYNSLWEYDDTIFIPNHNHLNLAVFSLIWSAEWVLEFFSPLYDKQLIDCPGLVEKIRNVFFLSHSLDNAVVESQKAFLTEEFLSLRSSIEPLLHKKSYLRIGLGAALNDVNFKMRQAGEIDRIYNYCPEALYGTANLWLFSRSYHNFMLASSQATKPMSNMRLLPMLTPSLCEVPRILCAAVWHVLRYYRSLKVDVRIIHVPKEDPGRDRSYYGGGIGHFPWLTISDDGCSLDFTVSTKGEVLDNLDFLSFQARNVFISHDFRVTDAAKELLINRLDQLDLPARKPTMLFPPENYLIEHPNILWS